MNKAEALEKIRANIAKCGQHIYAVSGGPNPRFAYSIGLSQDAGFELIMAGSSFYSNDEVGDVINNIASSLRNDSNRRQTKFEFGSKGVFLLREVEESWSARLMLGALDYYSTSNVAALQIVPDPPHHTVDVPDLSRPWNAISEPVWQWLETPWKYGIPKHSAVVTNLDALRGKQITEAMRWEDTDWELFAGAGPDVDKDEIRIVPFGTLLGADTSIEPVVNLAVGKGLWRDPVDREWHPWEISNQTES